MLNNLSKTLSQNMLSDTINMTDKLSKKQESDEYSCEKYLKSYCSEDFSKSYRNSPKNYSNSSEDSSKDSPKNYSKSSEDSSKNCSASYRDSPKSYSKSSEDSSKKCSRSSKDFSNSTLDDIRKLCHECDNIGNCHPCHGNINQCETVNIFRSHGIIQDRCPPQNNCNPPRCPPQNNCNPHHCYQENKSNHHNYSRCEPQHHLQCEPQCSSQPCTFTSNIIPVTGLTPLYSKCNGLVEFIIRRKNKTITLQWEPFTGSLAGTGIAYLEVVQVISSIPPYPISIPIYIQYTGINRMTHIEIDPHAPVSNIRFYLNTDGSASNTTIGDSFKIYAGSINWIVE